MTPQAYIIIVLSDGMIPAGARSGWKISNDHIILLWCTRPSRAPVHSLSPCALCVNRSFLTCLGSKFVRGMLKENADERGCCETPLGVGGSGNNIYNIIALGIHPVKVCCIIVVDDRFFEAVSRTIMMYVNDTNFTSRYSPYITLYGQLTWYSPSSKDMQIGRKIMTVYRVCTYV